MSCHIGAVRTVISEGNGPIFMKFSTFGIIIMLCFEMVNCSAGGVSKLVPGGVVGDGSVDHASKMSSVGDMFSPVVKKSPLPINKKIYEFYTAPITKFWMHTVCAMFTCRLIWIMNLVMLGCLVSEICLISQWQGHHVPH